MSDSQFDTLFPDWVVDLSSMFWTPVHVAKRAAQLLVTRPGQRILDIGSGCGKFCMVGSATSEGQFYGIEQRPDLVEVAKQVAERHAIERVSFSCQNMIDLAQDDWDGLYLFNPFHEQTSGPWVQIDDSVGYSKETQARYVRHVLTMLETLKEGVRVATYFGFGAAFPPGFVKIAYEHYEQGPLEIWAKGEDAML